MIRNSNDVGCVWRPRWGQLQQARALLHQGVADEPPNGIGGHGSNVRDVGDPGCELGVQVVEWSWPFKSAAARPRKPRPAPNRVAHEIVPLGRKLPCAFSGHGVALLRGRFHPICMTPQR